MGLSVPWACLREWGKGGAVEMTIKKRNYLWIILLKPEQGGHQGLLEWHVPLWRGSLAEMKGEGGGGQWGICKRRNLRWHGKKTCEEALQNLLKSFLPFEGGLKCCNEGKCWGNRKRRFSSIFYIASASHKPAFIGSCLTLVTCVFPVYL